MPKRFNNLSLYRLLATVLILIYHLYFLVPNYDIPYQMLLSAGVQGLVMLSAMLYSQKEITDYKDFFKKNFVKILIPAGIALLMMTLWNLISYLIAPYRFDNNFLATFYSFRPFNSSLQVQFGNFWFIPAILGCYILTPFLQKAVSSKKINFSKIFLILVVVVELIVTIQFYSPNVMFAYILGYYLGKYKFNEYVDPNSNGKLNRILFYLVLSIASFAIYYFCIESGYLSSSILGVRLLTQTIRRYASSFVGITTFLFIIMASINLNKLDKEPKLLKLSDKYSYAFYLFNQAFFVGAMNMAASANMLLIQGLIVTFFVLVYGVLATNISAPIIGLFLKKRK